MKEMVLIGFIDEGVSYYIIDFYNLVMGEVVLEFMWNKILSCV